MDSPTAIAVLAMLGAVVLLFVVPRAVLVVRVGTSAVLERGRRFRAVREPGMYLLIPYVDRVRARVDRREQVLTKTAEPIVASDGRLLSVSLEIYYQVSDPRAACYEVADYHLALDQVVTTALRNLIGDKTPEQARRSYHFIGQELQKVVRDAVDRWGIMVNRIELVSINQHSNV